MPDDRYYPPMQQPTSLPLVVREIVGVAMTREVAEYVALIVESRKIEAEFRHRIESITAEYTALAGSHEKMAKDRDGDRAAMMATIKIMSECGLKEQIADVYKAYISSAPRYSDDVVKLILERKD